MRARSSAPPLLFATVLLAACGCAGGDDSSAARPPSVSATIQDSIARYKAEPRDPGVPPIPSRSDPNSVVRLYDLRVISRLLPDRASETGAPAEREIYFRELIRSVVGSESWASDPNGSVDLFGESMAVRHRRTVLRRLARALAMVD